MHPRQTAYELVFPLGMVGWWVLADGCWVGVVYKYLVGDLPAPVKQCNSG